MNIKNKHKEYLRTSDFYWAAYCLASGIKLIDIDRADPRRFFFLFEDIKNREDLERDFLYGRTSIEPKKFISAIKELKQLLHS